MAQDVAKYEEEQRQALKAKFDRVKANESEVKKQMMSRGIALKSVGSQVLSK
jgi:hypothetical protein